MFSIEFKEYAENKFRNRLPLLEGIKEDMNKGFAGCTEEETILMKFFYGTMPLRDAGEYDFGVFLGYVRHALWLRSHMEWCKELKEDYFLQYVLYYRINSESIEDCRFFFYQQLKGVVEEKSEKEAVLAVNYWCGEHAAYEASDDRTLSPMGVYRSGTGRCGEESTFAVTALRSVGIPARQVYAPRWAHCDDNHAWVEVYIENEWHFLGACEPEEVLDKGWFINAASRALLVHSRAFSPFLCNESEELIGREEGVYYYNSTPIYGKTKKFSIFVIDDSGTGIRKAKVEIQVLNMGEYATIAVLCTDETGKTDITIGLGDFQVRASKDGKFGERMASSRETDIVTLPLNTSLESKEWKKDSFSSIEIVPPENGGKQQSALSEEQRIRNREKLKEAKRLREERMKDSYQAALAEKYPGEQDILRLAGENFQEIYRFLSKDDNPNRKRLLHSLSPKDYKDVKAEILESHLTVNSRGLDEEIFSGYVLCPRIQYEEITPYRELLSQYFSKEEWESFQNDPLSIWKYIKVNIQYRREEEYGMLCATPAGTLKLKEGSLLSQRILFAAICRTLGIGAGLDPVTGQARYWDGHCFRPVEGRTMQEVGTLVLLGEEAKEWKYGQNWTIGKLDEDGFVTQNYREYLWEEEQPELTLAEGIYRLILTSRMPNGSQHTEEWTFYLAKGERKEKMLTLPRGNIRDFMTHNQMEGLIPKELKGKNKPLSLLAYLEEGKEPTEHVLNELLSQAGEWNQSGVQIIFAVREKESVRYPLLAKVMGAISGILAVVEPEFEYMEPIARGMYLDPGKLPLLVLLSRNVKGIYGCSGYNAGNMDLILKIAGISQKRYILEGCVDSVESAVRASENGANRLELCSSLMIGGTTPTKALFQQVRKHCSNCIHVLIRPRFGDFCYSEYEYQVIKEEVRQFEELGADGIAVGILRPDGTLNEEQMKEVIELAGGMSVTLHRAFDLCADPFAALETAKKLGIHTILTSGQKNSCKEGQDCLKKLVAASEGKVDIMIGSGVNSTVVEELYVNTGAVSFHMSGKKRTDSAMIFRKQEVHMGLDTMSEYDIFLTDGAEIRKTAAILNKITDQKGGGR